MDKTNSPIGRFHFRNSGPKMVKHKNMFSSLVPLKEQSTQGLDCISFIY